MHGTRSPAAFLLACALLCAFVGIRPACAEDAPAAPAAPATPLARLTPDEQRAVRAKIPDIDALAPEKQELIVRNVEWWRTADPAARAMLKRRLEQAQAARLGGQQVGGRVQGFRDLGPKQGMAFHQGLALAGLGRVAWLALPAEIREHPEARSVEQPFAVAFYRKFWWRAFRALDSQAALAFTPSADLPPQLRERLATLKAEVESQRGDPKVAEKTLGRLKEAVLQARAYEATKDLLVPAPATGDRAGGGHRLVALGERLRDLARPTYDETLAEFIAKWKGTTPQTWAEGVAKMAQPQEPAPEVRRKLEALQVAIQLESLGPILMRHPVLLGPADALLKAALVDELGMPAEEFAALPPRGEGQAQEPRQQALRKWLERSNLPGEVRRHAFQQAFKRWPGAGLPGRGKPGGAPERSPDRRPGNEKKDDPAPREGK